jgi:hypothetical protein
MVNCTLKDDKYNGNCEGCNNRTYCMMDEIMDKVRSLEIKIAQLEASQAK